MNLPLLAAILSIAVAPAPALAQKAERVLAGPVPAYVLRVLDGDTVEAVARIWLGHYVETKVRVAEIDAPELKGRCAEETRKAEAARARAIALIEGKRVLLREVQFGKYAGRVVARIELPDGRDLAKVLVEEGHARASKRGRRAPWC
jgi:endonuclease YncB( thermonuclease family)